MSGKSPASGEDFPRHAASPGDRYVQDNDHFSATWEMDSDLRWCLVEGPAYKRALASSAFDLHDENEDAREIAADWEWQNTQAERDRISQWACGGMKINASAPLDVRPCDEESAVQWQMLKDRKTGAIVWVRRRRYSIPGFDVEIAEDSGVRSST